MTKLISKCLIFTDQCMTMGYSSHTSLVYVWLCREWWDECCRPI